MNMIDNLEIRVVRCEASHLVNTVIIEAGEPDQCGHRFTAQITRQGGIWVVQTNFGDIYESFPKIEMAYGYALNLMTQLDADGAGPDVDDSETSNMERNMSTGLL